MTVAIPLSRGRFALVDDEDAERVIAAGPWHTRLAPRTAYARHNHLVDGRFVTVLMHRFITGWDACRRLARRLLRAIGRGCASGRL